VRITYRINLISLNDSKLIVAGDFASLVSSIAIQSFIYSSSSVVILSSVLPNFLIKSTIMNRGENLNQTLN